MGDRMSQARPNREIVSEIYGAMVLLGAKSDLLSTIGSWGDSLPEADVLANLRAWNDATAQEVKARTRHYEMSCPHRADIPVEAQKISLAAQ
jgi:hypothetical protein